MYTNSDFLISISVQFDAVELSLKYQRLATSGCQDKGIRVLGKNSVPAIHDVAG